MYYEREWLPFLSNNSIDSTNIAWNVVLEEPSGSYIIEESNTCEAYNTKAIEDDSSQLNIKPYATGDVAILVNNKDKTVLLCVDRRRFFMSVDELEELYTSIKKWKAAKIYSKLEVTISL